METPGSLIESLFEKAEAFGKTTFELSKLRALEKITVVVTSLVSGISLAIILSLFILVLTVGVALLLGDVLGKLYYGFFIVAGFYLVVGAALYFFLHTWIKKPVSNLIIKQALQ